MTVYDEKFIRRHDGDQPQIHAMRGRAAVRIRPSAGRGAGQLAQEQRAGRGFDLTGADDEYVEARPYADPRH